MIPIDIDCLLAITRLTLHASHATIRHVYEISRTMPSDAAFLATLRAIEQDDGGPVTPPAPRDGACPICDAQLTDYRGHDWLCPINTTRGESGSVGSDDPGSISAGVGGPMAAHPDFKQMLVRPDAKERARLIGIWRRACRRVWEEKR